MTTISIIGLGLIGASLGMALRSADPKTAPLGKITVLGFDQDKRAASEARGRLAVDSVAASFDEAVRAADILVLATPVQTMRDLLVRAVPLLRPGTIVTDTASTKAAVQQWADQLLPSTVPFVGGHPMAGRERAGAAAAQPDLFRDAIYCLTPSATVNQDAIDLVEGLATTVGAKPYFIDPAEHDAYVAGISHLPFLLSIALVEATTRSAAWREMSPLASSGYRDLTRLASGDVVMHRDICLTNGPAIDRWIGEAISMLEHMREQVREGDVRGVTETFTHAKEARDVWLASKPNLRPGEDDFVGQQEIPRPNLFGRIGKKR
jgi:prephenate dehydrogenase